VSSVRYTAAQQVEVRRLAAAGWLPNQIRTVLEREGWDPVPHLTTILDWLDQDYYDRRRAVNLARDRRRRAAATSFRWPGSQPRDEWKTALMAELRREGASARSIATTMGVLFGDRLTGHQVEYRLGEKRRPTSTRKRRVHVADRITGRQHVGRDVAPTP
jgi:hypothetical protein